MDVLPAGCGGKLLGFFAISKPDRSGRNRMHFFQNVYSLNCAANLIILSLFGCVACLEFNRTQSGLNEVPRDIPDRATRVLLRGNKIKVLREGDFSDLTSCTYIDLGANCISEIQPGSFNGLAALLELDLDRNDLTGLKKCMFQNLTQLIYLILHSNAINSVEDDSFDSLFNLEQLHLAGNALTELRAAMFHGLTNIKLINLDGKRLTSIDSRTFSDLPRALELALDHNPLVCDGRLCWLKEEEKRGTVTWLEWAEHIYKPTCSGDVVWETWECTEDSTISSLVNTTKATVGTNNETTNDTLVLAIAVVGAFLGGIVVSAAVGVICWKRRTKSSDASTKSKKCSSNEHERTDTSYMKPDVTYEIPEEPSGGHSPHNIDYTNLYDKPKHHSYLEIND